MDILDRIGAFVQLGQKIDNLSREEISVLTQSAGQQNAWFTVENVEKAFRGISFMLEEGKIEKWISKYSNWPEVPKVVGIVMAGNIPLVGFHDLLCVLISGHFAAVKPSSQDSYLLDLMIKWIIDIEPRFKKSIEVREKLTNVDAVIATGSDNTSRYFEYYFKDIPHIIRKNRTSIAILDGTETDQEIEQLGDDIFSYFGLGCRNISKIFTPIGYDFRDTFKHFEGHSSIIHHHKYKNNYDYHKSIYLVNKIPHLDAGFFLTISTDDLVSPLSVLYHQEYNDKESLKKVLAPFEEKIQCTVGHDHLPFGSAQQPELWDYPDNIDVIDFLVSEVVK